MLPYKGNKQAIASNLIKFLSYKFPNHNEFYDLFGGGGNITTEATKLFKKVHYNETLPYIHDAVKSRLNGTNFDILPKEEWISRDEFFKIRNGEDNARKGLVLTSWSFANDCSGYIYGKDIEAWKHAVHRICFADTIEEIEECFKFLEKRVFKKPKDYTLKFHRGDILFKLPKGSERRYSLRFCVASRSLQRLQSLESLESLQRLERLESLESLEITTSNLSYEQVEAKGLLYCDIPYRTKFSKGAYGGGFDHDKFYEWAINNPNTVVFSEYLENLPEEFIEIWRTQKRNLASGGTNLVSTEILAWNGK